MGAGMLEGIGFTPVVGLEHFAEPGMVEVWVELEPASPTGLTVALDLARELGPGRRVVTPLVDSGEYPAGDLYA